MVGSRRVRLFLPFLVFAVLFSACGEPPASPVKSGATCGDGTCDPDESVDSCSNDCPAGGSYCGDGSCDPDESVDSCSSDCAAGSSSCGDGTCDADESVASCSADCGGGGGGGGGGCVDASCPLAASYTYTFSAHIMPTQMGVTFGLADCVTDMVGPMSATGTLPPYGAAAEVQAYYAGTVSNSSTDCPGASISPNFEMGLGRSATGGLLFWENSSSGYVLVGEAIDDGTGTYLFDYIEMLGDGALSLGQTAKQYGFTAL